MAPDAGRMEVRQLDEDERYESCCYCCCMVPLLVEAAVVVMPLDDGD